MTTFGKVIRTTAFRLTVVYLLLFMLFAVSLVGYFAWNTRRMITDQITETVNAEITELRQSHQEGGLRGLVDAIDEMRKGGGAFDRGTAKKLEQAYRALAPNAPLDQLQGVWRFVEAPANIATLDAAIRRGDRPEIDRIRREIKKAEPKADIQRRLREYRKKKALQESGRGR